MVSHGVLNGRVSYSRDQRQSPDYLHISSLSLFCNRLSTQKETGPRFELSNQPPIMSDSAPPPDPSSKSGLPFCQIYGLGKKVRLERGHGWAHVRFGIFNGFSEKHMPSLSCVFLHCRLDCQCGFMLGHFRHLAVVCFVTSFKKGEERVIDSSGDATMNIRRTSRISYHSY